MLKMKWFLLAAVFLIPHEVLDLQRLVRLSSSVSLLEGGDML